MGHIMFTVYKHELCM